MQTEYSIGRCEADDLGRLRTLLAEAGLPVADVDETLLDGLLVARSGGRMVGAIGLQAAGADGLLRSLVVDPGCRGRGLGVALLTALEGRAVERGIRRLYLLTDTAAGFFPRHGYQRADRDAVPGVIAATAEFRELCPASAVCLAKTLPVAP